MIAGEPAAFTALARTLNGRPALCVIVPNATSFSARPMPAVCQSASLALSPVNALGRIAKLSVEQPVTVGVAVDHRTRTRTSRQASATAAKLTVDRPAVIVGFTPTV